MGGLKRRIPPRQRTEVIIASTRRTVMDQAREVARATPADRNRAADFYRTLAIYCVVLGHWIMAAPHVPGGQLVMDSILARQPWTQYLTWILQVMPVFFFVGGYANAASWSQARHVPEERRLWASSRMRRLLLPVVPLILLWSLAAVIVHLLGTGEELVRTASRSALIPVWFLAVYIMVTLVVPVSHAAWERFGLWSIAVLALLAIATDLVGVGLGQSWLRWANYGLIWLSVHQLGYWWRRGDVTPLGAGLLALAGAVWMFVLLRFAGYPVSMVSVPGESFSNSSPPTTAMFAVGWVQIGLLLLVSPLVSRGLLRETPWALVILLSRNVMTIFLWHLTAMILVIGLSLALGGRGLQAEPGSGVWWALRPLWLLVCGIALSPLVAIFARVESGARVGNPRQVKGVQTVAGTMVACLGLSNLALHGVGGDGFAGLNWLAVLSLMAGVILTSGWPNRSTSEVRR